MNIPNDKVLVVASSARGGSSTFMDILRELGADIAGDQWPFEKRIQRWYENATITQEEIDTILAKDQGDRTEKEHRLVRASIVRQGDNFRDGVKVYRDGLVVENDDDAHDSVKRIYERYENFQKDLVEIRKMNPNGFWEIAKQGFVMRGGKDQVSDHYGKAIKLMYPAVVPRNDKWGIDENDIWKMIILVRDPRAIAESQTKLRSPIRAMITDRTGLNLLPVARRWTVEISSLIDNITDTMLAKSKVVFYEDLVYNTSETIDDIAQWLGVNNPVFIANAKDAINPELNRSTKSFSGWDRDEDLGAIAELMYDTIKSNGVVSARQHVETVRGLHQSKLLELVTWVDENTFITMTPAIQRQWNNHPEHKKDFLRKIERTYRRGMSALLSPSLETNIGLPEYTIQRPADLGPLTREMVRYRGTQMTYEQAKAAHAQYLTTLAHNQGDTVDQDKLNTFLEYINGIND